MLFNSISFFVFLPIVLFFNYIVPNKFKWVVLLVSSCYFYMSWKPEFIILIFISTAVNYFCALKIHSLTISNKKVFFSKKFYLAISLVISLGMLFFFKYFNFFSSSVNSFFSLISLPISAPVLDIILPVGISFYTFQTLSYTIDVYKGELTPEKHFGYFALYVSYFPQLVAGPIERSQNLLPQLRKTHPFNYETTTYGLKLMAWGFFKKLCIADIVAVYVNKVYNSPLEYQGFSLVIATFLFALQIYCDFSGYSDIAIGTSNLLGIKLMQNFKSPYFANSIKGFWSRWHISLSTWFRDYVYIPLGGNRVKPVRKQLNLLTTFLLSGLWHGANWTYVIWGALHGFFQIIENIYDKICGTKIKKSLSENEVTKYIYNIVSTVFVFSLVCFAWVFFRANNLNDAVYIISNALSGFLTPITYILDGFTAFGIDRFLFLTIFIPIVILTVFDFFNYKVDLIKEIGKLHFSVRWAVYIALVLVIIFLSEKSSAETFIYFQF